MGLEFGHDVFDSDFKINFFLKLIHFEYIFSKFESHTCLKIETHAHFVISQSHAPNLKSYKTCSFIKPPTCGGKSDKLDGSSSSSSRSIRAGYRVVALILRTEL